MLLAGGALTILLSGSTAVEARLPVQVYRPGPLSTYAAARAATMNGDARRAATLYSTLAAAEPGNRTASDRAIGQALVAGEFQLALRLAGGRPLETLGTDARLLIAADALHSNDTTLALAALEGGTGADLRFLQPLVRAWIQAEQGGAGAAVSLGPAPRGDGLAIYREKQTAFLLLRQGRTAEAKPIVSKVLANANERTTGLRLSIADSMLAAGDRAGAIALLAGQSDTASFVARAKIARGEALGLAVRTPAEAFAVTLTGIAIELRQGEEGALPLALVQVARFAAPARADNAVFAGMLLIGAKRTDDGLAVFRQVPAGSPLASATHDAEVRALIDADRQNEALSRAQAFAGGSAALADDHARVGDVLSALGRHAEAAVSFGRAATLVESGGPGAPAWMLHLLRGGALERGERWAEAAPVLERALALAPNSAVVLNYLGYARLERGLDPAGAEAMIARASALMPDDPSITDSLGWAEYRRGRFGEAIATLSRAAAADPGQAEIHEHLGDALFAAGRRFEARFAWEAARVAADDAVVVARIAGKLANGLTAAAARPAL